MIRKSTMAELDPAARVRAVNAVYASYLVPLHFNEAQLEQHVRCNDIALDRSPLWVDEAGDVVALGLLGVRGEQGWVGGFGVVPEHRGEGLGRELARELLAAARRMGLARVQLEVLTQNLPAIRTYERVGFRHTRDLRIMSRAADAASPDPAATPADAELMPTAPASLIATDGPRAHPPCWQRAPRSLLQFEGLDGLAWGDQAARRAFAIYRATPEEVRVGDLAGRDARDLASIAGALVARHPGRRFMILNEPEDSPVCGVLESLGFKDTLRQHEMTAALS